MILWKTGCQYYWMSAGAYVCDADGRELQFVQDRAAVVAYLRSHPDRPFELAGRMPPRESKLMTAPDLAAVVVCGNIRYDSGTGALANHSFNGR